MAKPRADRSIIGSRTYFVTANTSGGRSLFQSDPIARLFLRVLYDYRAQAKFALHEFVLMPTHFHLLVTPTEGSTIERSMQLIKGGLSYCLGKELGGNRAVWQRGYVEHRIRDRADYLDHRTYIHRNPVKARLSEAAERYPYCSAFPGFELDAPPEVLRG